MENHINNLLSKFVNESITPDERTMLKNSVSELSDQELKQAMSDVWEQYEAKTTSTVPFEQIARKLSIKPQSPVRRTLLFIAKVAAAIAIPLLIGIQIHLYITNDKLNKFIGQQLAIQVESGEKAAITLPDGTKVYLNAATSLSYPSDFGLNQREIYLTGEAYLEVAKDTEKPFHVHTDEVEIEVLGTKFNVSSYPDQGEVETTLIEGSVKLTTKNNSPHSVIMKPNQKVIYSKKNHQLSSLQTTGHFETAWTRGELVFRSAKFSDIIEKLKKRYGADIQISGDKYNTDLFTGSFKEEYIHGVLKLLQMHYQFTYTEKNGKILIKMK
ncbi:MAG: FecR family protein [Bacteroides xylanisolvens]